MEISQLAGKLVLSNAGNRAALVLLLLLLLLLDRGVLGAAPAPPVSQQRDACLLQAVDAAAPADPQPTHASEARREEQPAV